jgi:hypothetical protein
MIIPQAGGAAYDWSGPQTASRTVCTSYNSKVLPSIFGSSRQGGCESKIYYCKDTGMEHRAWQRRWHVTINGAESVRLPAKHFLKDMYQL